MKDAISEPIRNDDGDEHDDLLVVGSTELVDKRTEGCHDRDVVGMPTPGYTYQTWMLAEAKAVYAALSKKVSTARL